MIVNSISNCKLSYYEQAAWGFAGNRKDDDLKKAKSLIFFTTIDEKLKDRVLAEYKVYYCNKVPAGYYNKYQWHILMKNPFVSHESVRDPVKPVNQTKLDKLIQFLKSNRRKPDLAEQILQLCQEEEEK